MLRVFSCLHSTLDIEHTQGPSSRGSTFRMPQSAIRRRLASYAPDWILTLLLAGIFFAFDYIPGFRREFSPTDTTILFPFAVKERVNNAALFLIAVVAPFVIQVVVNVLTIRSWWDFHNGTLGLLLSLTITGTIVQFTKVTVGRPRPDLISRCMPKPGSADPTFGLSTSDICTQTNASLMRDGFRSFPSGHAGMSFAGLGFLSFYLAGKIHLFDHNGHARKAYLVITPLCGAALVAISRSMDNRHHWQDLAASTFLALVVAYFAYRQYYPDLASKLSNFPYPQEEEEATRLPMHHGGGSVDSVHEPLYHPLGRAGTDDAPYELSEPGGVPDV